MNILTSLLGPDLIMILLSVATGAVGYWIRHRQGSGLPQNLEGSIKNLLQRKEEDEACCLLRELANKDHGAGEQQPGG